MPSIKQIANNSISTEGNHANLMAIALRNANKLPDFRNLGVCVRTLVIVNFCVLIAAILQGNSWVSILNNLTELSAWAQPVLLISIILLYVLQPWLNKLAYRLGAVAVIALVLIVTYACNDLIDLLINAEPNPFKIRPYVFALTLAALVLYYFNLRYRALTPAIAEARLQALQARIRPHFLFNCINGVISVVRNNPKLAETALEDMADLFRVLMADNRDLVPLAKEIALSRQYLALEKMRLDERLQITWQVENMPPDALMPPLVLQPLLENAVYHGIEPLPEGGEITIKIHTLRHEVHFILTNPYLSSSQHSGNKMALMNIRERLALHFDVEAQLTTRAENNLYEVHIVIPYKKHNHG
ncbi:MAG TPA: histidine kinase [Methylophilaceae bacterium]|jgi:two-component system sensor histidine kinase AlgZ